MVWPFSKESSAKKIPAAATERLKKVPKQIKIVIDGRYFEFLNLQKKVNKTRGFIISKKILAAEDEEVLGAINFGRAKNNDIQFDKKEITLSKEHGSIVVYLDKKKKVNIVYQDTSSLGTMVNGHLFKGKSIPLILNKKGKGKASLSFGNHKDDPKNPIYGLEITYEVKYSY